VRLRIGWLALPLSGCVLIGYDALPLDAGAAPDARDGGPFQLDAGGSTKPPDSSSSVTQVAAAPECTRGTWCSYHCGGGLGACQFTCPPGAFCDVRCEGAEGCRGVECSTEASCAFHCPDSDVIGCNTSCSSSTTCPPADAWCGQCRTIGP